MITGIIVSIFLVTMALIILALVKKKFKMKKIFKIIVIIFLIISCVIFIAHQYLQRSSSFLFTKTTNLSEENIGGLKLYENIDSKDFLKKYGTNSQRIDNALFNYYKLSNDLIIATNKQKQIIRITTGYNKANTTLKTNKGINLESSVDDVIKFYGKNYYKRMDDIGVSVIGYVDKENKITLEFFNFQNIVTEIKYDISSMQ